MIYLCVKEYYNMIFFTICIKPKQSYLRPLGYIYYGRKIDNRFNTRIHINTVKRAW